MAESKTFAESDTTPAPQPMVAQGIEPAEPTTGPPGPVIARSLAALPPPNGKPAPERALQLLRIPGSFGTVGRAGMAAAVQRTVGNARLSRMVADEEILDEESAAGAIQAKLTIGRPGDLYEQEADHVAQRVMRKAQTAAPLTGRVDSPTPLVDEEAIQKCAGCRLGGGCGEEIVRRQPVASNPATSAGTSAIAVPDAGAALSGRVREQVEPILGADLSGVRVHRSPAAQSAARSLQAKAFTHRNHIWLGPSQSPEDLQLMAHEATHVVQQGAGSPPAVQRRPEDYHRAEDGSTPERRLQQAVDREVPEADRQEAGSVAEARDRMRKVDRGELAGQSRQLEPAAQPDVDRPAREQTGVEAAARETETAAKSPAEPVAKGAESAAATAGADAGGGGEGGSAPAAAAAEAGPAAGLAESAFALAASIPEPAAPREVVAPEPVVPVDAGGQPLPSDPAGDAEVASLAEQIQVLREQGLMIRQQAAQERGNAEMLRGNLEQVRSGVAAAERGVESTRGHLEYRRQALSTARRALTVSEEKTARVAREAPEFQSKADEGRADSGPMAGQARQKTGENARRSPEDGEAAGNARRQGQQLSRIADDAATIDRTIAQTRERAGSLAEEAARAQGLNEQTRGKLDEADATLARTEGRIGELDRQTREARTQVEALAAQPDQLVAQAEELDQQGLRLIEASQELEQRLHQVERSYEQGMRGVPAERPAEEASEEEPVQRTPDDSYEGRERIDPVSALPSWLTGAHAPTEQQRREEAAAEQQRRRDEIAEIRARAGGDFASLGAGEKMGIALRLAGRNLFRSVGNIRWPGFGALALGIIDPRGPLSGVLGGLGMMLSGGANLLSAEQWRRDPLGNALKSAADIATGLTIILGSITALAGVIAAAMTALTILSLGFAAPVTGPIIAFCTSVMIAVGGWTIAVGKIALVLQALVLIKNLIDAATARTAEDLQSQSEQIRADVGNAGNVLLQMGMAKLAQKGGQVAQRGIEGAGGGVRAAAGLGAGTQRMVTRLPKTLRWQSIRMGRQIRRGIRSAGGFRPWARQAVPAALGRAGRGLGRGVRRAWRAMREPGPAHLRGRAAFSREFLVGRNIPPGMRGLWDVTLTTRRAVLGYLGPQSAVVDSNMLIALDKQARGVPLQEGERRMLERLGQLGSPELAVSETAAAEVLTGPVRGRVFPISVSRRSAAYRSVLRRLRIARVGGRVKGAADRAIIADAFFARTQPGLTPRVVTHDPGIYNKMFKIRFGVAPDPRLPQAAALLQGRSVPVAFPNGFQVTIRGKTILVVPIVRN